MDEIITIAKPCDCIVTFAPEHGRPMCHTVCYQVHIDPEKLSPSGEFIRFDQFREYEKDGKRVRECVNEIHGWKRVDEILILEVLEEFEVEQGRSVEFARADAA